MKKQLLLLLLMTPLLCIAQVTNNTCSTADVLIPATGSVCDSSADTADATMSGSPLLSTPLAVCNYTSYKEVWFQFTATSQKHAIRLTNVNPSDAKLIIGVFTDCSPTTAMTCGRNIAYSDQFTPGQLYKIRVMASTNSTASLTANFTICITTYNTNLISASSSQYTPQQLVNDVLLNDACQQASTITSSTGTNYGSANGIGYFEKNNSNFQFDNGVILSSGTATNAAWPVNLWLSSGDDMGWLGDADLLNALTGVPGVQAINNASKLEFNFVPQKDNISIRYIFGSNDYGQLQCYFGDAMAILLTDLTAQTAAVNIAVVPGTTTPVCVTTILNTDYGGTGCSSQNPSYFGNFYSNTPNTAPVGLMGVTVPLTAEAAVEPGHLYHLKIVVADEGDPTLDAVVFIDAENFDIGIPKNIDIASSNGLTLCEGETTTLSIEIEGNYNLQWSRNGLPIEGSEGYTFIVADQPGEYTVTTTPTLPSCSASATITILNNGVPQELLISDYTVTDTNNDGFASFDLSAKTDEIDALITGSYAISYYETNEDALNETNAIEMLYTNIANPQLLYVRIENSENGCAAIKSFSLSVQPQPTPVPTGAAEQTFNNGETLADLEVEGENIQWYADTSSTITLSMTTLLVDGNTYYASQTVNSTESTERLAVTVSVIIVSPPMGASEQTFTEGETLSSLEVDGENIQWYADTSSSITLPITTLLIDGNTYYASQTLNNTESTERLAVTVSLIVVSPPTGASEQQFTEGETLADLEVDGENIQWYETETGDTPLNMNTVLVDNTTYYAAQSIDGVESAQRLGVTAHLTAGIDHNAFACLHYYPNPANSILTIENINAIDTISVLNALGQTVFTKTINSNSAQVDVSSLSKGVYFVTIASGSATKTVKIIKE
jgi:hypothetical protein